MFLQVSVCPRGGGAGRGVLGRGCVPGPGGCLILGAVPGGSVPGGVSARGGGLVSQHALRQNPPPGEMPTVADGTRPTGMHSCFS